MRKLMIPALASAGLMVACAPIPDSDEGERLYNEFCASCHGDGGQGDGPVAASLDRAPSDLTTISARNSGTFPMAYVISTIDGYTRAEEGNLTMPEFGVMMEDQPTVMVDTGDGILTPVPEPLFELGEYLRSIQQ